MHIAPYSSAAPRASPTLPPPASCPFIRLLLATAVLSVTRTFSCTENRHLLEGLENLAFTPNNIHRVKRQTMTAPHNSATVALRTASPAAPGVLNNLVAG